MNSAQYTPGPWIVGDDHPRRACLNIRSCDGFDLASLYSAPSDSLVCGDDAIWRDDPERVANADIMAAAPELLECLIRAVEASGFCVSGPTHPDVAEDEGEPRWVAHARAAIAKTRKSCTL